jgi:protein TonB
MKYGYIKNISIALSITFHAIILSLFLMVNLSVYTPEVHEVELTFGSGGRSGSSGALGDQVTGEEQIAKAEVKQENGDKNENSKSLDLTKATNNSNDELIKESDKNKKRSDRKDELDNSKVNSNINLPGRGNKTPGNGSFGDDIDWGGQGQRKIYNWIIPPYPEGVDKSIDIRLKFVIMPDGTVGNIIPLTKADTRLETAAINSLRQWRFEPLNPYQKQVPQTAVIVFPFRLQ